MTAQVFSYAAIRPGHGLKEEPSQEQKSEYEYHGVNYDFDKTHLSFILEKNRAIQDKEQS
jgi:hypothetical protein